MYRQLVGGYTHRFCREDGEKATSRRKELLAK
jgi:hypothetical protein